MKDNKNSENNMQYLPIGMCLGVGFGTMIGTLLDAQKRKTVKEETQKQEEQTEEDQQKTEE